MPRKKKTIDEATGLLTWLIAETVAERIIFEKYEAKLGKGNIKPEHDAAMNQEKENWAKFLEKKAEGCFAGNERFRKTIMSKGNKGRDSLYSYMYHWMGVADERVWENGHGNKTQHTLAELSLKRFLDTGEIS